MMGFMRKARARAPALAISALLAVSPSLRAEPFCKDDAGTIRVESTAPSAKVFIDDVAVGETPYTGTVTIEQEKKSKSQAWGVIGSTLGGIVFGGLGAVLGIVSGNPVREAKEGFKSGATKEVFYCARKATTHTVKIEKSGIYFASNVSSDKDFPTVSGDLSGIGFQQARDARDGGDLLKARDLFKVVASFGAKEAADAEKAAKEIDDALADEKRRAEEFKRSLEAGRKLVASGREESLVEAVSEFKKAAELDPKSDAEAELKALQKKLHDDFYARALAFLRKGRYYPAVLELRKALAQLDLPETRAKLSESIRRHKETALR